MTWADVITYFSILLTVVGIWLSVVNIRADRKKSKLLKLDIKNLSEASYQGVKSTEDFWKEWSTGPDNIKLNEQILLGGRKKEMDSLLELSTMPVVVGVQAISREEALAFIISCFKNSPEKEVDFFKRSFIVDSPDAFKKLAQQDDKPLILIPRFEDNGIINQAATQKHIVLVPLGADSSNNWGNRIVLPPINRDTFVEALKKSGFSKEAAERHSKESARNITVLRRQLEFVRNIPEWAKKENVREIIPALLAGRWDENAEKDRILVAKLARMSYEEYSEKLVKWQYSPDPPFVKIGSNWRLTSPLDAWANASQFILKKDFELLHTSFLEVLGEVNPNLGKDTTAIISDFVAKRTFEHCSEWLREGITQSLILTSVFGTKLKFDLPINAHAWVDRIIAELLNNSNPDFWKSIEYRLPLIAEASPSEFIKALRNDNTPIDTLFDKKESLFMSSNYHTGLLWALEGIAWDPEYLLDASKILMDLVKYEEQITIVNKPINSLTEIFKPWHFQTFAKLEERIGVLSQLAGKNPQVAWVLLCRLLPDFSGVGHPTHKMRWRLKDHFLPEGVMYREIWDTHSSIVNLLLSIFDDSEEKLAQLIQESIHLNPNERLKIIEFAEKFKDKIVQKEYLVWHSLRKIIYHHRSHPDTDWALPETELQRFEALYHSLEPKDSIQKNIWLFNENWPQFLEGYKHERGSHNEQHALIASRRAEVLDEMYKAYGIEKIKEIGLTVKEPWAYGETLAMILEKEEDIISLSGFLNQADAAERIMMGFAFRKSVLKGNEWVYSLFETLRKKGFDGTSLAKLLTPINQDKNLWTFVDSTSAETIKYYWNKIYPHFFSVSLEEKIQGITKLIEHKRYLSALSVAAHFARELPSDVLVEILLNAASKKSEEENVRFDGYNVYQLLEVIDERNDVDIKILIRLEWLYLNVLTSYGTNRTPKLLHEELSKSPDFFMEVVKWVYTRKDKAEEQKDDLSQDQIETRAKQAYDLIHSWTKIPGMKDKEIDGVFLKDWVNKVRELAASSDRTEVVDMLIGQVLAKYPEEKDKVWPPDIICEVIESINTRSLKNNFSAAIFNKYGSSSRGPFDGGDRERNLSAYFSGLAKERKAYPNVSAILTDLSKEYLETAKQEDDRAERDRLEY